MLLEHLPSSPELCTLVAAFEERSAHFGKASLTHPLPARPDLFIEIYLAERYRVSHAHEDFDLSPEVSLVGPHGVGTTRLFMAGEIRAFSIRLQPGAIHRLLRFDMNAIANRGVAMADVFGKMTTGLRDVVLRAPDFPSRIAASEAWLGKLVQNVRPIDQVDMAARMLLRSGGQTRIEALAQWTGLSERQFARRFSAQIGLNPKLYARTIRLNSVFTARQKQPEVLWTELAHAAGYADQAHFVRECRNLTGLPPSTFFTNWARIPST